MRYKQIYLPLLIAMGISHPLIANEIAQNQLTDNNPERITIWGSAVADTSARIDQKTIEKLGKNNVANALSTIPGVSLQKSGSRNELQVRVRGFDNRQVPVFYDGIPIYIPYDGNLDLGRFLTSNLDSIEVSKGYTSLLQGPNQMGGSINLTTHKPTETLEASAGYRQGFTRNKTNAYDANASLSMSNDLGYLQFSGSQLKQDYLGLPYGTDNDIAGSDGELINSAADDKRGIVKLGFTPNADDEYVFTYINQNSEKNNPPYAGTSPQKSRYWQWPEYDKESYYYQGTTKLGDIFTLKSRVYHDNFVNTLMMYNSLKDLNNKNGSYSHYDDYSNGAGLQLAAEVRQQDQLAFAIHWKEDIHREKDDPIGDYDRFKDRTISASTEYQWAVDEKLNIVAGISYDKRTSLQAMQFENNGSITEYDDNDQNAFNWQAMAKYQIRQQDYLSVSFSDRSRFPTLKERYTTSKPSTGQVAIVNPHLDAERARSIDITYNGLFSDDWSYEASIYYNRVDDAIQAVNIDANTLQNRNIGQVDYSGVDIGLKGRINSIAEMGLSYSYTNSDVKSGQIGEITGLPTQMANAWITVTPWEPIGITLAEEARSSNYSNSDASQVAAGFAITNIRVDYTASENVKLNASVNNLFDHSYEYSEGFIEQGLNYWLGVEVKI